MSGRKKVLIVFNIIDQYTNFTVEIEGETFNLNGVNTQVMIILNINETTDFQEQ